MSTAVSTYSLVDIALASLPQEGVLKTAQTFLDSHRQVLDCDVCIIVIGGNVGESIAEPLVTSASPLLLTADATAALVEHCAAVFSSITNRDVMPVPQNSGIGKTARHFVIPNSGVVLLAEDRTTWDACMHATYLRIIDGFASSLHLVSERERSEETRLKLGLATRAAGAGFFEWNIVTHEMRWDSGMRKLFGVPSDQFCGTGDAFTSRLHPDSRETIIQQVEAFLEHGGDETGEFSFSITTDHGEIRRVTSHALQIRNKAAQTCLIGISYDISELELARTQSMYRSDFENLLLNLSMHLIKPLEEDFNGIVQDVLQDVALFVSADRAYVFEYDLPSATCSNTHEWCADGVQPELDNLQNIPTNALRYWLAAHEKGQPFILRGVADLDESHPLRQILEPQGVQSLATFPLIHGDRLEGFIGFDAVFYERRWSDVDTSILKLLSQLLVNARDKARAEKQIRRTDTELRRSRDRAKKLAQEALLANRSKTDFIARVSHELRTPLHAINGLASVLIDGIPAPDRADHLQTILSSGESMLELINDILDFVRPDSEGITLHNEPIDLHRLLAQVAAMFVTMASQKTISLRLEIADAVPQWVLGDQLRIRQILQNLVSNAVKFTNAGSVTITAFVAEHADDCVFQPINLCVIDTGTGIPEAEFDNLFTPFFQLNDAVSVNRGTGLGLPISKMLAELMGGKIRIDSAQGEGSRFCAELMLEPAPQQGSAASNSAITTLATPSVAGMRILLAEDNPVNAGLVKLYLRDSGAILDTVVNGAEACDNLESTPYDVILMDCEMPIMDGFEATRRIRGGAHVGRENTPIIGVTANAMDDDLRRCLRAGMTSVLNKPFNKSQLMEALSTIAARQNANRC